MMISSCHDIDMLIFEYLDNHDILQLSKVNRYCSDLFSNHHIVKLFGECHVVKQTFCCDFNALFDIDTLFKRFERGEYFRKIVKEKGSRGHLTVHSITPCKIFSNGKIWVKDSKGFMHCLDILSKLLSQLRLDLQPQNIKPVDTTLRPNDKIKRMRRIKYKEIGGVLDQNVTSGNRVLLDGWIITVFEDFCHIRCQGELRNGSIVSQFIHLNKN